MTWSSASVDGVTDPDLEAGPGLSAEERAQLTESHGRRFSAGESLFREGDPARIAFLLLEGRVRLLKRVRAAERSLLVARAGDVFGESALLDEAPRRATAVALTAGLAIAMDKPAFLRLLQAHPSIATHVAEQLVRRVRDAEDQVEIVLLRDASSKVIAALLNLSRQATGSPSFALSPVELSSRAGLDVETVKRAVSRLREQDYLRIVGERVEVPDVDALRRLYNLLGTKDELRGQES